MLRAAQRAPGAVTEDTLGMADDQTNNGGTDAAALPAKPARAPRKRAPRKTAGTPAAESAAEGALAEAALTDPAAASAAAAPLDAAPGAAAPVKAPRKRAPRKAAAAAEPAADPSGEAAPAAEPEPAAADVPAPRKATRRRRTATPPDAAEPAPVEPAPATEQAVEPAEAETEDEAADEAAEAAEVVGPAAPVEPPIEATRPGAARRAAGPPRASTPPVVLFQPPVIEPGPAAVEAPADETAEAVEAEPPRRRTRKPRIVVDQPAAPAAPAKAAAEEPEDTAETPGEAEETESERRRRRRRGRRGRGRGRADGETGETGESGESDETEAAEEPGEDAGEEPDGQPGTSSRRRRRRRRAGTTDPAEPGDESVRTVVKVREPRAAESEVQGVRGSTRLEAKRQRRREGRDQGRRRPPIVTEAEFLARRESVDRLMLVRQTGEVTQIAVLEDDILVEHYVTRETHISYAGNVYLGRVQNVLPSMEAAFVDIGKGRNAVLYAGEVNYDASALEGRAPRIEQALKSGQSIVVQVTKDPMGHKGARLTSQISLPGRYMVYVPEQSMTGISRKLPDTERARLKNILKKLKPETAGIIIRTAAEGASEEDLTADLRRLQAQWEVIQKKAKKESAPALLHGEPDLVIRVVRDHFNEDFRELVVEGAHDYELIEGYLSTLAPDLMPRLRRHDADSGLFEAYRVDEQIAKGLDRKVALPSGGSLVIDRTEAMTVVDVNTGKFTGKGGNLEETVTKNNLEAAEEIVRQLRLRDIGGIIVVDFIDMILESNRELVMRRLKECLGRDRTKHQVSELTSLGLLQMTRKRIGQGLLEAFSEPCAECAGRGIKVSVEFPTQGGKKAAKPKPIVPEAAEPGATPAEAAVAAVAAAPDAGSPDGGESAGSPPPSPEPPAGGGRRRRGGRGKGGAARTADAPSGEAPAAAAVAES